MENKFALFLKDFFFKFNPAFLSHQLEERLKYSKAFFELFYNLRKRICFYFVGFILFSCFVAQLPKLFFHVAQTYSKEQNSFLLIGEIAGLGALFFTLLYLKKFIASGLLKDNDFFIARLQIATRYLLKPSVQMNYRELKTSHFFQMCFAFLDVLLLAIFYHSLFVFLSGFVFVPIAFHTCVFLVIGAIQHRNVYYSNKTQAHYLKDVSYFLSIQKFLSRIRFLGFDTVIKKQILSFAENNSFLYLKIFRNEILIAGIKYASTFLFFAMSIALCLVNYKSVSSAQFVTLLLVLTFITYYFLSIVKIFEFRQGASEILQFFKSMDIFNAKSEHFDVTQLDKNKNVVSFENASFIKNDQVVLHNINQHLKEGQLISVIGGTQEERSNYLSACAGHLHQIGGKVHTPQDFEFLSRNSIIFEGSIRENIIQFHEYDPIFYHKVLSACALNREIDLLPLNDLTKLIQHGTEFSSSFLRKIAIARVIYARAKVNFFDDPFVDISVHDAAKIFFEGFQQLLEGTTRIFCTDHLEYAALSDDIVLCKGGKIAEHGAHVVLLAQDGLYARLFYAGAENKRLEILQNYQNQKVIEPLSPIRYSGIAHEETKMVSPVVLFGEHVFENFKQKMEKFSYVMKMFFPVFVSKHFYGFFTFLTLAVWSCIYAFYFIFQNLAFQPTIKTSLLFLSYGLISCLAFSAFLICYKNVYQTCTYIIENVSKFYFAGLIAHGHPSSASETQMDHVHYNWKSEHILALTGRFYIQILHFLIFSMFFLTFVVFVSTIQTKLFVLFCVCAVWALAFLHNFIQLNLLFGEDESSRIRLKFHEMSSQFFDSFQETQSKTMRAYLLEKLQAKIYGLYFSVNPVEKRKHSFLNTFGFSHLLKNYSIIESMIFAVKTDAMAHVSRLPSINWPPHGTIHLENVKFHSAQNTPYTLTIPAGTKCLFMNDTENNQSVFIQKLRMTSQIASGIIKIDGEEITLMNSSELYRRIGYIGEFSYLPFLTIRDHLDPYGYHDDSDLWEVLNKTGISQHVALFREGLFTKFENIPQDMYWSGEILLFSLARCILNQNKIICIDHITASDDVENRICRILEDECKENTVIFSGENATFREYCTMIYPENDANSNDSTGVAGMSGKEEQDIMNSFLI